MMSMLDDFGGQERNTLRTSSAVTGESVFRTGPWWGGKEMCVGSNALGVNVCSVSATLALSLVSLSTKLD